MRWFKHSTASHDDPDISDAWDTFGDSGYIIFFVLLEIYGEEFNHLNGNQELNISKAFLRRKLRKSWTKVEQSLNFYLKRKRIEWKIDPEDESRIYYKIPKFIELASNWTGRKKKPPTEVATEAPTAIEVEEEVDKESTKNTLYSFALTGDRDFKVDENYFNEKKELYPGVDIILQFRRMSEWLKNNPQKQKSSERGIKNFITNWLKKEQDKRPSNIAIGKKVLRYKDFTCVKCKTEFKYDLDVNENMCPGCHGFYRKDKPPKPDSRVEELTDKLAKSTEFPATPAEGDR